jgi:hypothetical protein
MKTASPNTVKLASHLPRPANENGEQSGAIAMQTS